MPWRDPQFWIVSLCAIAGLWLLARPLVPRRGAGSACGGCASGAAAARRRRTTLTIEGQRIP